jgi:hypothetical protein
MQRRRNKVSSLATENPSKFNAEEAIFGGFGF